MHSVLRAHHSSECTGGVRWQVEGHAGLRSLYEELDASRAELGTEQAAVRKAQRVAEEAQLEAQAARDEAARLRGELQRRSEAMHEEVVANVELAQAAVTENVVLRAQLDALEGARRRAFRY